MAGAGPYHHALSNLDDNRRMIEAPEATPVGRVFGPISTVHGEPMTFFATPPNPAPDGYTWGVDGDSIEWYEVANNKVTVMKAEPGTLKVGCRCGYENGVDAYDLSNYKELIVTVS